MPLIIYIYHHWVEFSRNMSECEKEFNTFGKYSYLLTFMYCLYNHFAYIGHGQEFSTYLSIGGKSLLADRTQNFIFTITTNSWFLKRSWTANSTIRKTIFDKPIVSNQRVLEVKMHYLSTSKNQDSDSRNISLILSKPFIHLLRYYDAL